MRGRRDGRKLRFFLRGSGPPKGGVQKDGAGEEREDAREQVYDVFCFNCNIDFEHSC